MGNEHKESIKTIKTTLIGQVMSQLGKLECVDAQELGEVVDMVKDCFEMCKLEEEAKYYETITKAMEETDKHERRYYGSYPLIYRDPYEDWDWYRDMDRDMGRMYYSERGRDSKGRFTDGNTIGNGSGHSSSHSGGDSGRRNYHDMDYTDHEREMPIQMRDRREGTSPIQRKYYMESKEMHKDKATQLNELEKYMQELTKDLTEMIEGASPEEKQYMEKKIQTLATKIGNA